MAKAEVIGSSALAEKPLKVITIAASEQPQDVRLRVAAYARVSSSSADQLNSFAAQNRYYSNYISKNSQWKMIDIYADEGITGTSIEKREDFKRMVADCNRGLIDRILVKSISRFARNTTECLETVRALKAKGVSVFFEEQNIDTGKVSGEMLTAVFASLAQAESESISKNVSWGIQKRMESGQFNTCFAPLGFNLVNGKLEIVPNEAIIIRQIYSDYLHGRNSREIAANLNDECCMGRTWDRKLIDYILTNERYAGNALLQKRYTTAAYPKAAPRNHGEKPQYFIAGINPAIIDMETFETAQELRKSRRVHQITASRAFTKRIYCTCGSVCRFKLVNGKPYWVCVSHDSNKDLCINKAIPEAAIYNSFIRLYYNLRCNLGPILMQMLSSLQEVRNRRMLWSIDIIAVNNQISELLNQNQMLTTLKQRSLVDPDIFIIKSNEISEKVRQLKHQKEQLLDTHNSDTLKKTKLLAELLEDSPEYLDCFDHELFSELIGKIIIVNDSHLTFRLMNGLELTEKLDRSAGL